MSLSVQVGLLLAVATALTSIVSFLYKHRGAVQAPEVDFRRPVHSSLVLFRSGWYTLGIVNQHDETGLVVPPGDPAALANALRDLLGDPALRRRLGEAGRRRVAQEFTAARMAARTVALYRDVLAN